MIDNFPQRPVESILALQLTGRCLSALLKESMTKLLKPIESKLFKYIPMLMRILEFP